MKYLYDIYSHDCLQELQVRDAALQVGNLLPFFKIGATLARPARVHSASKSPVFRDCSKIKCKTGASTRARFWGILR